MPAAKKERKNQPIGVVLDPADLVVLKGWSKANGISLSAQIRSVVHQFIGMDAEIKGTTNQVPASPADATVSSVAPAKKPTATQIPKADLLSGRPLVSEEQARKERAAEMEKWAGPVGKV